MPTAAVLLSTNQYVKVNIGQSQMLLQCLRDRVRIVLSYDQPAVDNSAFHKLEGGDAPLMLSSIDTNIWAMGTTQHSSLIVTEMAAPDQHRLTAFGEMKVESMTPVTQISATYGLLTDVVSTNSFCICFYTCCAVVI